MDSTSAGHAVTPEDGRELLSALARTLADAAEAALWAQWAALGASAEATRSAGALVDPEVLVLASLVLAQREPRLDALTHDWVALNADLLSVQRLRNIAGAFPHAAAPLRAVARTASTKAKDARWRPLARGEDLTSSDGALYDGPTRGESTRATRATRAVTRRSTKVRAVRAPVTTPPALVLRLRLVLGVGVKADVVAFALGAAQPFVTVRAMAAGTRYTAAAVRRAADDLAAAHVVEVAREDGGATQYAYDPRRWAALLGRRSRFLPWRSWLARYACVAAVVDWNEAVQATGRPLSAYAFDVRMREVAAEHADALRAIIEPSRGTLPPLTAVDTAAVVRRFERFAATFERDV